MRHTWHVRFFCTVMVMAMTAWTVTSPASPDFCLAQDQVKAEAPAKTKAGATKQKKKHPAKPRAISLFQGGYDFTTPPSPESELKNRLKAPLPADQTEAGVRRRSGLGYDVGNKLHLSPGAAPVPDGFGGAGGGVRAMWQSEGNAAVSGGVSYDAEGRAGAGSPSPAGPTENSSPGPAAGVMLKYSF